MKPKELEASSRCSYALPTARKLPGVTETDLQKFLSKFLGQEVQMRKSKFTEKQIISTLNQRVSIRI